VSTKARLFRVLIADDHAPSRDDIQRALERGKRFSVCASVADAAGAVQAAVRERPAICLLDIRMPGGGLAAAWEIAARLPQAKIVMLTVSDDDADLFAALRAGAHGYLLKSMNLRRLPDALDGVLAGEAAIPRELVAHVVEQFRGHEPRWRQPVADRSPGQRLTSREWEVLALLGQQQSTGEIARRLMLSTVAVRVHIAAIVRKLGVPDRAAAIDLFRRHTGT
jgi:two-component system NarL family response regulator